MVVFILGINEANSCLDWLQNGYNESGVYRVPSTIGDQYPDVYCDMQTDGGGWLVLLRRNEGSVNFRQALKKCKIKIGDLLREFWNGLTKMNRFTSSENQELRIDLEDWEGNTAYAKYSHFSVSSTRRNFAQSVSGYSGTAGDALSSANGMAFTTKDSDNDLNVNENCAQLTKAVWWFKNCLQGLLTGQYSDTTEGEGIVWSSWKGFGYSLKSCKMKIRPTEE